MKSLIIFLLSIILSVKLVQAETIELKQECGIKFPSNLVYSNRVYYLHDTFKNQILLIDTSGSLINKIESGRAVNYYHSNDDFTKIGEKPYGNILSLMKDDLRNEVFMNISVHNYKVDSIENKINIYKPLVCALIDKDGIKDIYDFNMPPEYISGMYQVKYGNNFAYESSRRYEGSCYLSTRELGYADYDCCTTLDNLDLIQCGLSVDELLNYSPKKDFHMAGRFTAFNDSAFVYFVYPDLLPIKVYFNSVGNKKFKHDEINQLIDNGYAIQRIVSNDGKIGIVMVKATKDEPPEFVHKNIFYLEYNGFDLTFLNKIEIDVEYYNISNFYDFIFVDDELQCLIKTHTKKWKIINLEI